jgi:putative peptidoglycan lipid II flippase
MWLAIAPAMAIGIALALPLVVAAFQRGQFNKNDAAAVAGLLQVYLLALAPACLGNITGRGFYALKDIRTFSGLSSIESVVYMFYTPLLAHLLGPKGVALGFVLFFNISFVWTAIILRYRTGNVGGSMVLNSFIRTGLAALLGGVVAWATTHLTSNVWLELIFGGLSGLLVYGMSLCLLQSAEINQIRNSLRATKAFKSSWRGP